MIARHRALTLTPLKLQLSTGTVWNMPPPTQGLASLMILGLFDRLKISEADGRARARTGRVREAGFIVRNAHIQDRRR